MVPFKRRRFVVAAAFAVHVSRPGSPLPIACNGFVSVHSSANSSPPSLSSSLLNQLQRRLPLAASRDDGHDGETQDDGASVSFFDRFRASCPADIFSVRSFAPILVPEEDDGKDVIWAAAYRTNNNLPAVTIRDDLFDAMRIATSVSGSAATPKPDPILELASAGGSGGSSGDSEEANAYVMAEKPVAVARLRRQNDEAADEKNTGVLWVLDSMRCTLRKEKTDNSCDGGSEHTEALAVCIDELLIRHLESGGAFESKIKCKATLVSAKVLEDRGFRPVEELTRDMWTHTSSLDAALLKYADRAVNPSEAKSPGAMERSLRILSSLGLLDRREEMTANNNDSEAKEDSDYDPWVNSRIF